MACRPRTRWPCRYTRSRRVDVLTTTCQLVLVSTVRRCLIHPLLLRRSDPRRRRALERMEVFFPYLSARVRYRDERTQRLLKQRGVRMSPIQRYFGRLLDFALRSWWGRRLVGRASALKVAESGGQVRDSRAA